MTARLAAGEDICEHRLKCPRFYPILKNHGRLVLAVVANLLDQNVAILILAGVLTGNSDLVECFAVGHADINQRRPRASDKRLWVTLETFDRWGGLWIVYCRRVCGWRAKHAVSGP